MAKYVFITGGAVSSLGRKDRLRQAVHAQEKRPKLAANLANDLFS